MNSQAQTDFSLMAEHAILLKNSGLITEDEMLNLSLADYDYIDELYNKLVFSSVHFSRLEELAFQAELKTIH